MNDLERQPWMGEMAFFASHPQTPGMMTADGRVTLRPDFLGDARDAVKLNELTRLLLRDYQPKGMLSEGQKEMFKGTPYQADEANAYRSIMARLLSNDPSGKATFQQDAELRDLLQLGNPLGGMRYNK